MRYIIASAVYYSQKQEVQHPRITQDGSFSTRLRIPIKLIDENYRNRN